MWLKTAKGIVIAVLTSAMIVSGAYAGQAISDYDKSSGRYVDPEYQEAMPADDDGDPTSNAPIYDWPEISDILL